MSKVSPYVQTNHIDSDLRRTILSLSEETSNDIPSIIEAVSSTHKRSYNNWDDISSLQGTILDTPEAAAHSFDLLYNGSQYPFLKTHIALASDDVLMLEGLIKYQVLQRTGDRVHSTRNMKWLSKAALANKHCPVEAYVRTLSKEEAFLYNPSYSTDGDSLLTSQRISISTPCVNEEMVLYWALSPDDFNDLTYRNPFLSVELRLAALMRSENALNYDSPEFRLTTHVISGIKTAFLLENEFERDKLIKYLFGLMESTLENTSNASMVRNKIFAMLVEQGLKQPLFDVLYHHDKNVYDEMKDISDKFLSELLPSLFDLDSIPSSENIFQAVTWEPYT